MKLASWKMKNRGKVSSQADYSCPFALGLAGLGLNRRRYANAY